jgi:FdhD protein
MQSFENQQIRRFIDGNWTAAAADTLSVEEPLEIQLCHGPGRSVQSVSITMRTPGNDKDLALGFLFTEGILQRLDVLETIHMAPASNRVLISLKPEFSIDLKKMERHFYTTSSCGVCGKASIEALEATHVCPVQAPAWSFEPALICSLPEQLRAAQEQFEHTGGVHASALFDRAGNLLALREDVGRHNALDKLIGLYFQQGELPLSQHILLLSGRASFELLQKAAAAGIRMVCAVGAPSSLAVATAKSLGIALIGFLRKDRFNLYTEMQHL